MGLERPSEEAKGGEKRRIAVKKLRERRSEERRIALGRRNPRGPRRTQARKERAREPVGLGPKH